MSGTDDVFVTSTPAAGRILRVAELNRLARERLESGFPPGWVAGEISGLTQAASGHVYFSLKDEQAQVRCTLWRQRAQLLGWRLANGQQVEIRALVTLYEARGEFQLNVEQVRQAGQGSLFEQFLRRKAELDAAGLFDPASKRPLPLFPRRIGIVTSRQAAALRDVLITLARRAPQVEIILFPTLVQGDGAAAQIAATLLQAGESLPDGKRCDVLLLCRGGGSLEDLWAFNDADVVRAIRAVPIPVISGIGHETDVTLADLAADLRAPTPTAAAEQACREQAGWQQQLVQLESRLQRATQRFLQDRQQHIDVLARHLNVLDPASRLQQRLAQQQQQLRFWTQRLQHAAVQQFLGNSLRLQRLEAALRQLDPLAVLQRGYAVVHTRDGRLLRNADAIQPGQPLEVRLAGAVLHVRVETVSEVAEAIVPNPEAV